MHRESTSRQFYVGVHLKYPGSHGPRFSQRWSDTGPKLGYCFDPLLKGSNIAFSFFFFQTSSFEEILDLWRNCCFEIVWCDTLTQSLTQHVMFPMASKLADPKVTNGPLPKRWDPWGWVVCDLRFDPSHVAVVWQEKRVFLVAISTTVNLTLHFS